MEIFDAYGNGILTVTPDDSSYRHREVMGENCLTLKFSLAEHVEVPVGSWCEFGGDVYTLARPESLTMHHSRSFEYTLVMEGAQWRAGVWKFRDLTDGRLSFSLTAAPLEHLTLLVANLNAREAELLALRGQEGDPEPWTVGECVEHDEVCIGYDHDYCIDALARMAEEFGTEYEFSKVNVYDDEGNAAEKWAVSLKKVEYHRDDPLALSYGRGNGLKPDVGRGNSSDDPPVEVLYAQGGSDNIDVSKYPQEVHRNTEKHPDDPDDDETYGGDGTGNEQITNSTVLLLPPGREIGYDGEHFYYHDEEEDVWYYDEDGDRYYKPASEIRRYEVDARGFSISRIRTTEAESDTTGRVLAEDSLDCSEIYPKRVGTVTEVKSVEAKDEDGEPTLFYDFIDDTIPDEGLDYNECLIGGETMTVIFQSGNLAGREFDISKYDPDEKRFEVVQQEVDGVLMPDDGAFSIQPDDKYAVFNCMLPNSYICDDDTHEGAEWDMLRSCVEYMYEREEQRYTITGKMDGIWSKRDWDRIGPRIRPGEYVMFTDPRFQPDGLLIRITGVKDYINSPQSPELELSNETVKAGFVTAARRDEGSDAVAEDRGNIADIPRLDRRQRTIGNAVGEVGITLWGEENESGERSGGLVETVYGTDDTAGLRDMVGLYQEAITALNDAMTEAMSAIDKLNKNAGSPLGTGDITFENGVDVSEGTIIDDGTTRKKVPGFYEPLGGN